MYQYSATVLTCVSCSGQRSPTPLPTELLCSPNPLLMGDPQGIATSAPGCTQFVVWEVDEKLPPSKASAWGTVVLPAHDGNTTATTCPKMVDSSGLQKGPEGSQSPGKGQEGKDGSGLRHQGVEEWVAESPSEGEELRWVGPLMGQSSKPPARAPLSHETSF